MFSLLPAPGGFDKLNHLVIACVRWLSLSKPLN